jgi:hypothetical protein
MNLGAHLGHQFVLGREFTDAPALGDGARERLLAIEMPAGFQRGNGGDGVSVIRDGDDDGVDVLLIDQAPEIVVGLCGRELRGGGSQIFIVHVA